MSQNRTLSIIGLFVICLVISMPFYSANALAVAVQITKNEGQNAIPNYLDGDGDVWKIEAKITNALEENIDPNNVKFQLNNLEKPFGSCGTSELGTTCELVSPLTGGAQEGEYTFQVVYNYLDEQGLERSTADGDFVRVDGTAPKVTLGSVAQNDAGKVVVNYKVEDRITPGVPYVGLKSVEILDGESNAVLATPTFEVGAGSVSGPAELTFTGEGTRKIKIKAVDRLGHLTLSSDAPFPIDFVKPSIKLETLQLPGLGEEGALFISEYNVQSELSVDVVEKSTQVTVKASSDQALDLRERAGDCQPDDEIEDLWHCAWPSIEFKPETPLTITLEASDALGNTATERKTISLTPDTVAPSIEFLGTERVYEGNYYLTRVEEGLDRKTRIILRAREQGAGMDENGVRADLTSLGGTPFQPPTECENANTFNCHWDVPADRSPSAGVLSFGLSKFEDKMRNQGETQQVELVIDNSGPKVNSLALYGASEIGDKDYFQSQDRLKIELNVSESTGLIILLDMRNLVMDAETKYPENFFTAGLGNGWQKFDESSCEPRDAGSWYCRLETEGLRSGPVDNLEFHLKVQDTAGNNADWAGVRDDEEKITNVKSFNSDAKQAALKVDLLGLSVEDNPDYWEVKGTPKPLIPYVDLDTVGLIPARWPVEVTLSSKGDQRNVNAIDIELDGCVGKEEGENASLVAPALVSSVLYAGVSPTGESLAKPKIVLQLEPFDGRAHFAISPEMEEETFASVSVEYLCQLRIYSKVGDNAIQAGEIQDVVVPMTFGFSALGALDENLEGKIEEIKDEWKFKIADKIKILTKILQWARFVLSFVEIYYGVINIINIAKGSAEGLRSLPLLGTAEAIGVCSALDKAQTNLEFPIKVLQFPLTLLTCNPNYGSGWYAEHQKNVLRIYNAYSGRGLLGLSASSLFENIIVSALGLCLPGITQNLEDYRQVRCREILCYERDVPAGLATVDSCGKLGSYLTCRYVVGNVLEFPLIKGWDEIINFLKGLISSPFGWARVVLQIPCLWACPASNTASALCKVTGTLVKVVDLINTVKGAIDAIPSKVADPYCSQLQEDEEEEDEDEEESVKVEDVKGEEE